jgi:hypothetical protein
MTMRTAYGLLTMTLTTTGRPIGGGTTATVAPGLRVVGRPRTVRLMTRIGDGRQLRRDPIRTPFPSGVGQDFGILSTLAIRHAARKLSSTTTLLVDPVVPVVQQAEAQVTISVGAGRLFAVGAGDDGGGKIAEIPSEIANR